MSFTETVCLGAEVYGACLAHALSTEREEVVGLLFGEEIQVRVGAAPLVVLF
jgi:hypothetical protein